jgi:hypothetical protein
MTPIPGKTFMTQPPLLPFFRIGEEGFFLSG